jgi:hypothetical protein
MNISAGHLVATVHQDDRQTITVELREADRNLSVGFVEITLVPAGARVHGTNGKDDSDADEMIFLRAEVAA